MTLAMPRLKWHQLRRHRQDPAFARANIVPALSHGLPIEIDFRLTRDHAFVCLHDATLDRETTGSGPVAEIRRAELERLRQRGNDGQALDDPPLFLDELVAAVAAQPHVPARSVQLDVKEADERLTRDDALALARLLGRHASCFIAGAYEWDKLVRLNEACPELALGFDPLHLYGGKPPKDQAAIEQVLAETLRIAPQARMFYLQADLVLNAVALGINPVARLRERGAELDAWTVDTDRPDLDALLDTLVRLGCDQITTNEPERLGSRLDRLVLDQP